MTTNEWFDYADKHKDVIVRLINNFHPANRESTMTTSDFITAPNAEIACERVRRSIRENYVGLKPSDTFLAAVIVKDIATVAKILNETWFGVPESTACWDYDGFKETCNLLEDMPEDEEETAVH